MGALFCAFNADGVETRAHCYFKDVNGVIVDNFFLDAQALSPALIPAVSAIGLGAIAAVLLGLMVWSSRPLTRRAAS